MIEIKKVVLGLLILYVTIFSFLFIRQSYKFNKQMNQKINFETKVYYEEFISESRAKVQKYKALSTTNEQLTCLNEIDKIINISYKNQHPKATTYKELIDEYYNKTEEERLYNYQKLSQTCKLSDRTTNTQDIIKHTLGNMAIIEEEFIKVKTMYQIDIKLKDDWFNTLALPALDGIKENSEQSLRGRFIRNEINFIQKVLDLVGEDYE